MQIYISIDGDKKGPFTLFQVEEQLRDGLLDDGHLAWYDGLTEWTPLRDLPPFESFFRRKDAEVEDERRLNAAERAAKFERERTESVPVSEVRPWTRFWARNLDMWFFFVFCLALLVGFRAMGILDTSIGTFMSVLPMLMPVMYLMEAYCIDRWGATPGKALVGIQIRDADGNSLGFASAFRRSLGVFVLGMGCYVDLLSPIAMMFGYYLLMKNRRSFWDISTGSYVHHAPFQAKHVLLPLAIMFLTMFLFQGPMEEVSEYHKSQLELLRNRWNGETPGGDGSQNG